MNIRNIQYFPAFVSIVDVLYSTSLEHRVIKLGPLYYD
jgi:hypothetical protein